MQSLKNFLGRGRWAQLWPGGPAPWGLELPRSCHSTWPRTTASLRRFENSHHPIQKRIWRRAGIPAQQQTWWVAWSRPQLSIWFTRALDLQVLDDSINFATGLDVDFVVITARRPAQHHHSGLDIMIFHHTASMRASQEATIRQGQRQSKGPTGSYLLRWPRPVQTLPLCNQPRTWVRLIRLLLCLIRWHMYN